MPRTVIIGDIHGCLRELETLIEEAIRPTDKDTIILCGDILDKGPHPAEAVAYLRRLSYRVPLVLVRGNHEDRHERWRLHQQKEIVRGIPNPIHNADHIAATTRQLSAEDIDFLHGAKLYHALPQHGAVVVHGGITPKLQRLPLTHKLKEMEPAERAQASTLLRVRFVDAAGEMVPLIQQTAADVFWTERYDGRFGHVFYGHEPHIHADAPVRTQHTTGLDMGCVFGRFLCAAVLEVDQPAAEATYVLVPAEQKYAHGFYEE